MATARPVPEAGVISAVSRPLIGVLGGTFDPVHIGHLRLAVELVEGLSLQRMLLVPSGQPPHRRAPVAPVTDRVALLERAVRGSARLVVDARETRRVGPSYMVDTLTELRGVYPRAALCLVLGADAFAGLATWRRWQALPELAHLVVVPRPGAVAQVPPALAAEFAPRWVQRPVALARARSGCALQYAVPMLDISATRIRALLRAGRSVRHLVPPSCLREIRSRGLYPQE